jgi:hypothetical protein
MVQESQAALSRASRIGTQLRPMIEKAPLAASANEAWLLLTCFAFLAVMLVPFAWKKKPVNSKMRFVDSRCSHKA